MVFGMDKEKFMTVVVTALVSAAVATISRGIIDIAKNSRITQTVKNTAQKKLTKNVRRISGSFFMFAACVWILVRDISKPGIPDRLDVFYMIETTFSVVLWACVCAFFAGIAAYQRELRLRNVET
jgi:hypothetical protein